MTWTSSLKKYLFSFITLWVLGWLFFVLFLANLPESSAQDVCQEWDDVCATCCGLDTTISNYQLEVLQWMHPSAESVLMEDYNNNIEIFPQDIQDEIIAKQTTVQSNSGKSGSVCEAITSCGAEAHGWEINACTPYVLLSAEAPWDTWNNWYTYIRTTTEGDPMSLSNTQTYQATEVWSYMVTITWPWCTDVISVSVTLDDTTQSWACCEGIDASISSLTSCGAWNDQIVVSTQDENMYYELRRIDVWSESVLLEEWLDPLFEWDFDGQYTVRVIDSESWCYADLQTSVLAPEYPSFTLTADDEVCQWGWTTVMVEWLATWSYVYQRYQNDIALLGETSWELSINPTWSSSYTVEITHQVSECMTSKTHDMNVPSAPSISFSKQDETCNWSVAWENWSIDLTWVAWAQVSRSWPSWFSEQGVSIQWLWAWTYTATIMYGSSNQCSWGQLEVQILPPSSSCSSCAWFDLDVSATSVTCEDTTATLTADVTLPTSSTSSTATVQVYLGSTPLQTISVWVWETTLNEISAWSYTITAETDWCTVSKSLTVDPITVPDIPSLAPIAIDCTSESASLPDLSSSIWWVHEWEWPNWLIVTNTQGITESWVYTLTVTSPDQCNDSQQLIVTKNCTDICAWFSVWLWEVTSPSSCGEDDGSIEINISWSSWLLDGNEVFVWWVPSGTITNDTATIQIDSLEAWTHGYFITLDGADCEWSVETTLTEDLPTFELTSSPVACFWDVWWWSLEIDAPASADIYVDWSLVDDLSTLTDAWPGTYTIYTEQNWCQSEPMTIQIGEPNELIVTEMITGENVCALSEDVSIDLTVQWWTGQKTIIWENGIDHNNVWAWTYTYTVSDENWCEESGDVMVEAQGCNPACNAWNLNQGWAQVACVAWSENCTDTCSCADWFILENGACIQQCSDPVELTDASIDPITCVPWDTWSIDIENTFGGDNLTYVWNHDTSNTAQSVTWITSPGIYTVTVSSWTCNVQKSYTVQGCVPEICPDIQLQASALPTELTCNEDWLTAALTASFDSATPDWSTHTMSWMLPWWSIAFGNQIVANSAWIYSVNSLLYLSDGTACPYATSVDLSADQQTPTVFVNQPDPITCEHAWPRTLMVTNPQSWIEYVWKNEAGTIVSEDVSFETDVPGIYTVTATNSTNNCSAPAIVELVHTAIGVNCNPLCTLEPTFDFEHPSCPDNDAWELSLMLNQTSLQSNIEISWGHTQATDLMLANLSPESYTVDVSYTQDGSDCMIKLEKELVWETCFPDPIIPDPDPDGFSEEHCGVTYTDETTYNDAIRNIVCEREHCGETYTDEALYQAAVSEDPDCSWTPDNWNWSCENVIPNITVLAWSIWCDDDLVTAEFVFEWESPVNPFTLTLTNTSEVWNVVDSLLSDTTIYQLTEWSYTYTISRDWCETAGEFEIIDTCNPTYECVRPSDEPELYTICTPNDTSTLTQNKNREEVSSVDACDGSVPCQWYIPSSCGLLDDERLIRFRLNDALSNPANFCSPAASWSGKAENNYTPWRLAWHDPVHTITQHTPGAEKEFYARWECEVPWMPTEICELYVTKPPLCNDLELETLEKDDGSYDISWKTVWTTAWWRARSTANPSILTSKSPITSTENSTSWRTESLWNNLVWEWYVAIWVDMILDGEDWFMSTTSCEKIVFLEEVEPVSITTVWAPNSSECGSLDSQYIDVEWYLFNESEKSEFALCDWIPNDEVNVQYLTREKKWIWDCPAADPNDIDIACEAKQWRASIWGWGWWRWTIPSVSTFVEQLDPVDLEGPDEKEWTDSASQASVSEIRAESESTSKEDEHESSPEETLVEETEQTWDMCCYAPVENNSFAWVTPEEDAMIQWLNEKICAFEWKGNSRDFQPNSCLHRGEMIKVMTHLVWAGWYDIRTKAAESRELRWVTYADALRVSWYRFFKPFNVENTYECAQLNEIYDLFAWMLEKYWIQAPSILRDRVRVWNMRRIDFVKLQDIILTWLESSNIPRTCEEPKERSQCCYAPLGQSSLWASWVIQEVNNAICVFEWHDNNGVYDTTGKVTYGQLRKIMVHLNWLWSYDNTNRANAQGEWRATYYRSLLEEKWLTWSFKYDQRALYTEVPWSLVADLIEASYVYNWLELTEKQKIMIEKISRLPFVSRGDLAGWLVEIIEDFKQWATKPQCKF